MGSLIIHTIILALIFPIAVVQVTEEEVMGRHSLLLRGKLGVIPKGSAEISVISYRQGEFLPLKLPPHC